MTQKLTKEMLHSFYYEYNMTLQKIGDHNNISRERVRQLMDKYGLPRFKNRTRSVPLKPKFKDLQEYFDYVIKTGKELLPWLRKLINVIKCDLCNPDKIKVKKNLHRHHIKYPATQRNHILVVCPSCHLALHKKGIIPKTQNEMIKLYNNGMTGKQIAKKYKVNTSLIYYILKKHNVERRHSHKKYKTKFFELIIKEYGKGMSTVKVGEKYNINKGVVWVLLKRYSKTRTLSEAHVLWHLQKKALKNKSEVKANVTEI